jgi:tRNA threonylcarbamoyladenosine biosynthesis protein TsaE
VLTAFSRSPAWTEAFGERLGRAAFPGAVLALVGDLGVGKTLLTRGVGRGLGVPGSPTSPTFVLMMLHEGGRMPLVHADLYRLADLEEAALAGLPEALAGEGLAVVEWADRLPGLLPPDHLRIELRWIPGKPRQRAIAVEAAGPRHRQLEALLHAPA